MSFQCAHGVEQYVVIEFHAFLVLKSPLKTKKKN